MLMPTSSDAEDVSDMGIERRSDASAKDQSPLLESFFARTFA